MNATAFRISGKLRDIREIRVEDKRVTVVGIVVAKDESSIMIDDGTGQAAVIFDNPRWLENVEVGSVVKVMGTPLEAEGGMEIHADLLQRMNGLDLKLYRKAREELKELEREIRGD